MAGRNRERMEGRAAALDELIKGGSPSLPGGKGAPICSIRRLQLGEYLLGRESQRAGLREMCPGLPET